MQLITNWLEGRRNWHVGIVLYKQFGTDAGLKQRFEGKHTPHLQQLLEESLAALLQKPKIVLQPSPVKSDSEEMPATSDAVLEAIRTEWLLLYQKMNYLRHQLDKWEANGEEAIAARRPIALGVLSIEQQCIRIWDRRAYYLKHGTLPDAKPKEDPLPTDPVELGKMIETLKRNIRRNKAAAAKHPDNPKYPMLARQYDEKLRQLTTQLKTNEGTKEQ